MEQEIGSLKKGQISHNGEGHSALAHNSVCDLGWHQITPRGGGDQTE
jgi:hypothetical protein